MHSPARVVLWFTPLLISCATALGGGESGPAAGVGQPMPELTVREWNGRTLRLSDLRGKVVLLDIWASWCAPCKEEMPLLDDIAARLGNKGVEVVAVSIDEDRASAEGFLKRRRRWSLTVAHDPTGAVAERLQPPKMPTSYIIDRQGVLRHVNAGFERGDAERLEARLRELAGRR